MVRLCLQPPPANLDSLFLYIEDVIDVSSRLLSLLDQKQVQPGDPVFLQTLCKGDNSYQSLVGKLIFVPNGSGQMHKSNTNINTLDMITRQNGSLVLYVGPSQSASQSVKSPTYRTGRDNSVQLDRKRHDTIYKLVTESRGGHGIYSMVSQKCF